MIAGNFVQNDGNRYGVIYTDGASQVQVYDNVCHPRTALRAAAPPSSVALSVSGWALVPLNCALVWPRS